MAAMAIVIFLNFLTSAFIFDGLECKKIVGNGESIKQKKEVILIAKTVYGDTYSCINIYKQPAFNHPALSNHKIRMSIAKEFEEQGKHAFKNHTSKFNPKDIWLDGGCPKGTVPIRQMTKEQQERTYYANRALKNHSLASSGRIDFAGIIAEPRPGKKYHAAQADINLYNPKVVGSRHYSSATIAVESGINQIQVGWIVHPELYGDYRTRMYSFWTADIYGSPGCFNQNCPGFVALSSTIPLDFAFPNISKVEGEQYDVRFRIALETINGDWWLFLSTTNEIIGYWPKSIFTSLGNGADTLRWGGQVFTPSSDDTSSQMGSGRFKNGQRAKTCYMREVKLVDESDATIAPDDSFIRTQDSRCYYEGYNFFDKDPFWEYSFLFGGKGRKDEVTCVY